MSRNKMTPAENPPLIVYGKQPVREVLLSAHSVENLYLARELPRRDSETLQHLAQKKECIVQFLPKAQLQRVCGPVLHQGCAARLSRFHFTTIDELDAIIETEKNPLLLILDQIQDPHNLGAILRTAEIAGVSAVIVPQKGSAAVSGTVAKTSAGALFFVRLRQTENLDGSLAQLKEKGIRLVAGVSQRTATIYEADLSVPLALVIGSEGKGLRKNILRQCDAQVSIPQFGRINSLNASVSTAIILFEAVRQRTLKIA